MSAAIVLVAAGFAVAAVVVTTAALVQITRSRPRYRRESK